MKTAQLVSIDGLRAQAELDASQRDEMFALLERHFSGVTREQLSATSRPRTGSSKLKRKGAYLASPLCWSPWWSGRAGSSPSSTPATPSSTRRLGLTPARPHLDSRCECPARSTRAASMLLAAFDFRLSHLPLSPGLLEKVLPAFRRSRACRPATLARSPGASSLRLSLPTGNWPRALSSSTKAAGPFACATHRPPGRSTHCSLPGAQP